MSVGPGYCRAEIFRQPVFFDDNFAKGWTKTTGGGSVFVSTGELVQIDAAEQASCDIEKSFPAAVVDAFLDWRVILRSTAVTGGYLKVYLWDNTASQWVLLITQNSAGLEQSPLSGIPNGNTVNKIRLQASGQYAYCAVDYVAVAKKVLLVPDSGDLVEDLTVTLPLLNDAINSAKLLIFNSGGAYNGLVSVHDVILLWLSRDSANLGVPDYKVFGGRIIKPTNTAEKYGANYIELEAHGHAYELNVPPSLVEKFYAATNGKTIIEDALSLCSYVTKHPESAKWFGGGGSTDDSISSTHDALYDEEKPLTVIQEILEKAKNPAAVQGFVAYEFPSGVLIGHLRDSLDFASPIASITPFAYQRGIDLHPVRNKIEQYGDLAFQDGMVWWDDGVANWTVVKGILTSPGNAYIFVQHDANGDAEFYRTVAPYASLRALSKIIENLYCQIKIANGSNSNYFQVILEAPDASNYFTHSEVNISWGISIAWDFGLGPAYVGSGKPWTAQGSPDWNNIKKIRFKSNGQTGGSSIYSYVDYLKLTPLRLFGKAEDSPSQALYNVRMSKAETDEVLHTDAECQARAESILAVQKDPVVTLEGVEVDGDERYKPGNRQRVIVANDALDAYFQIVQVQHRLRQSMWDNVLNLSSQPQEIDYMFKLLKERQNLLERRT